MTYAGSSGGYPNIDSDSGPTDAQIEAVAEAIRNDPAFDDFFTALASAALTAAAEVGQQFNISQDEVIASLREMGAIPPEPAAAEVEVGWQIGPLPNQAGVGQSRNTVIEDVRAEERERCARVVDDGTEAGEFYAAKIRERKE